MPQALIAAIPALIGAGTAGTEIGLQMSGALTPSSSGSSQSDAMNKLVQQQQQQQTSSEQQAMRAAALNNQGTQGQFLTNPAFAAQVADLIGQPGDIGLAQQTVFNPGAGGQQNPFQTTPGLASGVG